QQQITELTKQITQLEKQRQTASDVAPIDAMLVSYRNNIDANTRRIQALEARIDQMKKNPSKPLSEQGAPWTAGIFEHASGKVLPLVVFE
ncbi:MAG: hypothetical protein LBV12_04195, partial [Puniceicoccales bacterium]|nr:hypothetical protein [Puniceicoccales bacterium]